MNYFKRTLVPILAATIWISISEFVRNEFLLKKFWIDHFESMGLIFPSEPLNGAIWGIWSLLFATAVYIIAKKFNPITPTLRRLKMLTEKNRNVSDTLNQSQQRTVSGGINIPGPEIRITGIYASSLPPRPASRSTGSSPRDHAPPSRRP